MSSNAGENEASCCPSSSPAAAANSGNLLSSITWGSRTTTNSSIDDTHQHTGGKTTAVDAPAERSTNTAKRSPRTRMALLRLVVDDILEKLNEYEEEDSGGKHDNDDKDDYGGRGDGGCEPGL